MIWLALLLPLCHAFQLVHDFENEGSPELARREDSQVDSSSDSSATATAATGSTSKTTSSASTTSIDQRLPAGGISLTSPQSSSTTYVKSGAQVTFGWNYTSLYVTPSGLNIEVICSKNSQTYTLATNQSAETSSVVWDTNKQSGLHLINAAYTLSIYDSSKSSTDSASAGELSAFTYSFSVYIPQSYTAWAPAAKYVNFSVRLSAPEILTLVLAALGSAFAYML